MSKVDFLDVPDCTCPVEDRCPHCGAGPGKACVPECVSCGSEWPCDDKGRPAKEPCPSCGTPWLANSGRNPDTQNPQPCPLEHEDRPRLPPCKHVRNAPDADLDLDLPEIERALRERHGADFTSRRRAAARTDAAPGTADKVDVMEERENRREAVVRPDDKGIEGRSVIDPGAFQGDHHGNGVATLSTLEEVNEQEFRRQWAKQVAVEELAETVRVAWSYHPGRPEYEERQVRNFLWWAAGRMPWYRGPKVYALSQR